MKRFAFAFIAAITIVAVMFAGCSSNQTPSDYSGGSAEYNKGYTTVDEAPAEAPQPDVDKEEGIADINTGSGESGDNGYENGSILQPGVDRKIVYTGNIVSNTKTFDDDYQQIMSSLTSAGGYVQYSSISGTKPKEWQDQGRSAQMTLRIPSDKFDWFITVLKGLGDNQKSEISGNDISLTYYNTESELKTLRIREERLQDLLNKATDYEGIIQLERELSDVSGQIQYLETNLRDYDSLIDYSTVNITLYEVNDIKGVTTAEESLGSRISNGFFSVVNALKDFGEGLIVFFVSISIVIVPLAIIILIIILLVKRSHKKHIKSVQPPVVKGGENNEI